MERGQSRQQIGIPPLHVMEREFQDTVIKMARAYKWECFYIPDSARAGAVGRPKGWPDLTLCHSSMSILIFAELKTDNRASRPTEDQLHWLDLLHECGEVVQLWRPSMWDHIEAVLKGPGESSWKALHGYRPALEWRS